MWIITEEEDAGAISAPLVSSFAGCPAATGLARQAASFAAAIDSKSTTATYP